MNILKKTFELVSVSLPTHFMEAKHWDPPVLQVVLVFYTEWHENKTFEIQSLSDQISSEKRKWKQMQSIQMLLWMFCGRPFRFDIT